MMLTHGPDGTVNVKPPQLHKIFLYACGDLPPRYPVPSVLCGAYVLTCEMDDDGKLLIWFMDDQIFVV